MSATPAHEVRHLLITGSVQGVGYRWNMVQQAQHLGLSGWVRNRRDGSVEALASGDNDSLATLIAWARTGPRGAQVECVHVERLTQYKDLDARFIQIATA